jgi:cystathionine beta-lyase/cystathionine gamma-synthase
VSRPSTPVAASCGDSPTPFRTFGANGAYSRVAFRTFGANRAVRRATPVKQPSRAVHAGTPGTVRVSVGIEDADDIVADFAQAIAA